MQFSKASFYFILLFIISLGHQSTWVYVCSVTEKAIKSLNTTFQNTKQLQTSMQYLIATK
jgi:hypothetical protein